MPTMPVRLYDFCTVVSRHCERRLGHFQTQRDYHESIHSGYMMRDRMAEDYRTTLGGITGTVYV